MEEKSQWLAERFRSWMIHCPECLEVSHGYVTGKHRTISCHYCGKVVTSEEIQAMCRYKDEDADHE